MAKGNNVGRPKNNVQKSEVKEVKEVKVTNKVVIDTEKEELKKKNLEQEEMINNLKNENEKTISAFDILQKQMQELQSALIKMQATPSTVTNTNNENIMFELGCRLVNGVTIYSPKREVEREIPYGDIIQVNEYEMEMLLKSNFVRDFLVKDVIYFVDKESYKKCKIFDHRDMSDEHLTEMLLTSDSNSLISEFNKLTREKKDDPVVHSLFYRIVELYSKGVIARMTYNNRKAIESYFKFSIDNAQMLVENIKNIQ